MSQVATDKLLVDAAAVAAGLDRMVHEIVARKLTGERLALIGIRRGGEPVAQRLIELLETHTGQTPELGSIDITLYRDDAATALPNPLIGPSNIPFDVSGRRVVLVDDVLYSGRTIRAALDALLDYGRPRCIELAVIADRGGRELPIQPDYCAVKVEVPAEDRVEVRPDDLCVLHRTAGALSGGDAR